ncbi:hypothetical protein N7462_007231 [Penicillium macrosclerotiorum]|uniref:uncharacterized protein n=1 Tax=Penicillium macrosclerotiorum TaxID=303699 RepID=UPI0025478F52|nr:uncharacterized protein N7462_007231 [Penicillium macrosclerotiorum]KAJ5678987.1 hypothetical protein N7462_007231 [Penicillium macrosclerotiorum]
MESGNLEGKRIQSPAAGHVPPGHQQHFACPASPLLPLLVLRWPSVLFLYSLQAAQNDLDSGPGHEKSPIPRSRRALSFDQGPASHAPIMGTSRPGDWPQQLEETSGRADDTAWDLTCGGLFLLEIIFIPTRPTFLYAGVAALCTED